MSKSLIAYFSHRGNNMVNGKIVDLKVGNTEYLAKLIHRLTGSELLEIKPVQPYPTDYRQTAQQATDEIKGNMRPAIVKTINNSDAFDTLILGFPNWCGTMPMPVFTFLEADGWAGKIIMPFCTSEGSGFGRSIDDLKKLCPYATIADGYDVLGHEIEKAEPDVRAWLAKNNITLR
jgi:flavodoxin